MSEREALEKIRLHGSPFWDDAWGTPAQIANDALNASDQVAAETAVEVHTRPECPWNYCAYSVAECAEICVHAVSVPTTEKGEPRG